MSSKDQLLFVLNQRYEVQRDDDISDKEYKQATDKYNNHGQSINIYQPYDTTNQHIHRDDDIDARSIKDKSINHRSNIRKSNLNKSTNLNRKNTGYAYISPYILLAEKRARDRIIRRKYLSMNESNHNTHREHDDNGRVVVQKHKNEWNENVHTQPLFDTKLKKQEIFKIEPKVHYFHNKHINRDRIKDTNGSHGDNKRIDHDDVSSEHSGDVISNYNRTSSKQRLTIKTHGVS